MLLALVIVAVLAQTLLKRYGAAARTIARPPKAGVRAPGAASRGADGRDRRRAPTPTNAIERARGLESVVQQQAQDMSKRIDDADQVASR